MTCKLAVIVYLPMRRVPERTGFSHEYLHPPRRIQGVVSLPSLATTRIGAAIYPLAPTPIHGKCSVTQRGSQVSRIPRTGCNSDDHTGMPCDYILEDLNVSSHGGSGNGGGTNLRSFQRQPCRRDTASNDVSLPSFGHASLPDSGSRGISMQGDRCQSFPL